MSRLRWSRVEWRESTKRTIPGLFLEAQVENGSSLKWEPVETDEGQVPVFFRNRTEFFPSDEVEALRVEPAKGLTARGPAEVDGYGTGPWWRCGACGSEWRAPAKLAWCPECGAKGVVEAMGDG